MKAALQKIYVILGKQNDEQLRILYRTLSSLFSHANLTSNVYLVAETLPEGMPQVERIQKEVGAFLRENLFARLYVHFVHHVPLGNVEEMSFYYQYYYHNWKRATNRFDREGYIHQEVPRIMLLPLVVPDHRTEPSSLVGLLDMLRSGFLLPSLYLDWGTFHLADNKDLLTRVEKVYYGHGKNGQRAEIVCNLCRENIFHDTSAKLECNPVSMADPCPAALIISVPDGKIYACMDAFLKRESLADIDEDLHVDSLMVEYDKLLNAQRGCLSCREHVAESLSELPLPKGAIYEVGDLLYHFGRLHQEAGNHVEAAESFKRCMNLSPIEEAGSIQFRLGLSYTKLGCHDQALEAFSRAEETYQDQYYFHFYRGLCFFEKGDYRTAVGNFSEACRMSPPQEDLVRILIFMGTCHNNLGEYDQASVQLEMAKEKAGPVREVYSALGFSCFQLKEYEKAIENLTAAVEIGPDSAIDYASLGANYREKGDIRSAIAMYEKALALDPTITSARENLAKLRAQL